MADLSIPAEVMARHLRRIIETADAHREVHALRAALAAAEGAGLIVVNTRNAAGDPTDITWRDEPAGPRG